jgi:hypothetical protein
MMEKDHARIIVKHIIQDAFEEMFKAGYEIETEHELAMRIETITDAVLENEYEIKFKNLIY